MIKWTSNNFIFDLFVAAVPTLLALSIYLLYDCSYADFKFIAILWFVSSLIIFLKHARPYFLEGKIASITVLAGYLLWYCYPAFIDVISANDLLDLDLPVTIANESALLSLLCIALFFLSWLITSHSLVTCGFYRAADFAVPAPDHKKMLLLALGCALLGLAPYALSGFSPAQILSSILESRAVEKPWVYTSNIGNASSPFLYLVQCFLVAGSTMLWTVTQDKRFALRARLSIGVLALLFSVIIFFDQGTRSIIVLVFSPILLAKMIAQLRKMNSIGSLFRLCFKAMAAVLLFVLILQFQMLFRASVTRSDTKELIFKNVLTLGGTIDYFSETAFAMNIVPSTHDYFRESVLVQFLVSPVPRFIWPDKPVSQVVRHYTLQRWGIDIMEEGGNVFPGIVGQYYMSWGWAGPVLLGVMLGFVCYFLDAFCMSAARSGDPYVMAMGFMSAAWIFLNFRVLSPGFLYPVVFSALILYLSGTGRRSFSLLLPEPGSS
jgi:hypothetical protein